MFITRDAQKSALSAIFLAEGETGWLSTELALEQIWFLVHLEETDFTNGSDFSCNRTVLLFDFRSVERLILSREHTNVQLRSVHIVTPAHVNGSDSWKMDQLRAVWHGREQVEQFEVPMNIFETISGRKYPSSFSALSIDELSTGTLKFDLPH